MKITLMEAVMANLAAEEVGRQAVPYSLALALMKVKQATAAEAETFAAEERKLVENSQQLDEDGNHPRGPRGDSPSAPPESGENTRSSTDSLPRRRQRSVLRSCGRRRRTRSP